MNLLCSFRFEVKSSYSKGSVQYVSQKFSTKVQLKFKGNVPPLVGTTFTVNLAYCMPAQSEMTFAFLSLNL